MTPPKNLPSPALAQMWQEDIDHGIDPTGDFLNRPEPGRVQTVEPLVPPELPPPNWSGEQVVASLRSEAGQPEPEPPTAEALQSRPARRRRRHWERPR